MSNGNSGRHTQAVVDAVERHITERWVAIHADDIVTADEERELVGLDRVRHTAIVADVTETVQNAIGHRDGITSPWAQRVIRESLERLEHMRTRTVTPARVVKTQTLPRP